MALVRFARAAGACLLGLLALSALSPANAAGTEFFRRCARDAPNVNDCLNEAIQYAIRSLRDGYDALGLSKLDPLNLEKVTLKSPEGKTLDLLNYDVYGLASVVCQNSSYTSRGNTFRLSFDLLLPQFDAKGSYKMERFFLGTPHANDGVFTMSLTGYRANFVLDGNMERKEDGNNYAKISGVSSSFNGGTNPRVQFSNLSQGRNRLWNREPEQLLQAYKAAIDQVHPVLSSAYANLIFQKVPLDQLFPPTLFAPNPAMLFKRCGRDNANLNECLNGAIQYAIRSLKEGNEQLGLSKLDPLNLERVTLKSSDGKTLDLINYDVNGLKDVVCKNSLFESSGNKFWLSFELYLPQFNAAGSYKMERFFLGSPKPNEGSFTFNLTGYHVNFYLEGDLQKGADGKLYASLSGLSSYFFGGVNPRLNFSNLSVGRNRLWNREPHDVLQAYKLAIDQIHPVLASAYGNLLFQKVSFDDLLPATQAEADGVLLTPAGLKAGVGLYAGVNSGNFYGTCTDQP